MSVSPPVCRVPSCPHCLAFASARCFLYLDSHLLATTVRLGIFYRCERFTLRLRVIVTKKKSAIIAVLYSNTVFKTQTAHFFPCCFFRRRSRQLARLQPRYVPLFLFFSSAVNADKSPFKKCGVLQQRRRFSTLHKRQQTRTPRPRTLIYEPTHTYHIGQRLTFDRMLTLRLVTQCLPAPVV